MTADKRALCYLKQNRLGQETEWKKVKENEPRKRSKDQKLKASIERKISS